MFCKVKWVYTKSSLLTQEKLLTLVERAIHGQVICEVLIELFYRVVQGSVKRVEVSSSPCLVDLRCRVYKICIHYTAIARVRRVSYCAVKV